MSSSNATNTRKRRRVCYRFCKCCAELVKKVNEKVVKEKENKSLLVGIQRVEDRVLNYTGISAGTFQAMTRTAKTYPKANVKEKRVRPIQMSDEDLMKIRPALVSFIKDKITPTLSKLNLKLKTEFPVTWKWSRATLHRAMVSRLGFKFRSSAKNYYDRIRDTEENLLLRVGYTTRHLQNVNDKRPVVYMDETWINKNTRPSRAWQDGTKDVTEDVPPGKVKGG